MSDEINGPRIYRPNDYLGCFECPNCHATDKCFYNDCPVCEESFVECSACGRKWEMSQFNGTIDAESEDAQ